MVNCPFCAHSNEEGSLFCEQCRSDISNVAPAPSVHAPPTPMPDSYPGGEPVMALVVEEPPMAADIVVIASVEEAPIAVAIFEETVVAEVIEEPPMVAAPFDEPKAEVLAEIAEVPAPPPGPMMPAGEPVVAEVVAAAAPAAAVAVASAPAAPAGAKPSSGTPIPAGAQPKLVVQRGLKIGEEYNIFGGENFIGRADDKPVDIDLTFQEPEDRVWTSRQHALLVYDEDTGTLTVEDLNSSNGTFVNRERVYPGQPRQLFVGNTVQIGTVHMKIKA